MKPTTRRAFGFSMRVLLAVLSATFLALQGLSQFGKFQDPKWLPVALAVGVAVCMLLDSTAGAVRAARQPAKDHAHARIQKSVVGALALIAEECGLDITTLGGSVFRIQKTLVWPRWRRIRYPFIVTVLIRPVRFRISDTPQASTVTWTTGKGAIGEVLRTRTAAYVYWAGIAKKHAKDPAISIDTFNGIPEKTRGNLTYDEFICIVGKYAEVLAIPVMSEGGGRLLGVISIDRPYVKGDTMKHFDDAGIRAITEQAAAAMRGDL